MPHGRGISENELLIPFKSPPLPVRGVTVLTLIVNRLDRDIEWCTEQSIRQFERWIQQWSATFARSLLAEMRVLSTREGKSGTNLASCECIVVSFPPLCLRRWLIFFILLQLCGVFSAIPRRCFLRGLIYNGKE